MITYDMTEAEGSKYVFLYQRLKEDISEGRLRPGEKMPSKRSFAGNLGISTVTVENAYGQLASEGYIRTVPRKGYYVAEISDRKRIKLPQKPAPRIEKPAARAGLYEFSSNRPEITSFPFSVWSRLMRESLSKRATALLNASESTGVRELREAIAAHLSSYRGMTVDPDQIVVGAGTEYLYSLIINLLGRDKVYCMEDPGYRKPGQIYESNNAGCVYAGMDERGIRVDEIRRSGGEVIHTSPTHHFPTGITMPVSRRYELLAWADEKNGRYIIEDDYDSEFRLNGMPLSPFYSIDDSEKVIYMNTFSKSLAPTVRISYMVLPEHLINRYYANMSFYACTVSTFEQYALADFISQGYFEKHINRMRLHYGRKRAAAMEQVQKHLPPELCRIIENDSGLHFIMKFSTGMSDSALKEKLRGNGIGIQAVSDYYHDGGRDSLHAFILNYSNLDMERLPEALEKLKAILIENGRD